jgi:DNA polymerase-1
VPGVGPKTATEVLQQYGSVKNIYKNLEKDPKLQKRFGPYKKEAELSEELVTLERHVPIEVPMLGALALPAADSPLIEAYFVNMGFVTLLKRLKGKDEPPKAIKSKKAPQPGLF